MGIDYDSKLILGCYVPLKEVKKFLSENNIDPEEYFEVELEDIIKKKLYFVFAGNYVYGSVECYICITKSSQLTVDEINELLKDKDLINECEELSKKMNGTPFSISSTVRIS